MRDALIVVFVATGVACFAAGDVTWLVDRQRRPPMRLWLTGTLIFVGVLLVVVATVLRLVATS